MKFVSVILPRSRFVIDSIIPNSDGISPVKLLLPKSLIDINTSKTYIFDECHSKYKYIANVNVHK